MKCPSCGYDSNDKRNYDVKLKELLNKRDSKTKKMLSYVINKISLIESIPKKELYYFLQSISNIDDISLYHALISYDNSNPYEQNKGINYLKAIIINFGRIMEKQKDFISKRIGARAEEL